MHPAHCCHRQNRASQQRQLPNFTSDRNDCKYTCNPDHMRVAYMNLMADGLLQTCIGPTLQLPPKPMHRLVQDQLHSNNTGLRLAIRPFGHVAPDAVALRVLGCHCSVNKRNIHRKCPRYCCSRDDGCAANQLCSKGVCVCVVQAKTIDTCCIVIVS